MKIKENNTVVLTAHGNINNSPYAKLAKRI